MVSERRRGDCLITNIQSYTGTIRKVQEAAIRINRKRIEALYREKKQLSEANRPSLFQDDKLSQSEVDGEAIAAIEQDRRVIHAIQQ